MAEGDADTGRRPSFAKFWKKGKQKLTGKGASAESPLNEQQQLAAAGGATASSNPANSKTTGKPTTDKEKAAHRRAQVRRAQIEHRQRKANYTKQLELDISQLRDLVTLTERETAALFKENFLIREALDNAGIARTPAASAAIRSANLEPQQMQLDLPLGQDSAFSAMTPNAAIQSPELFGDIDVDDLTVTLSLDGAMGTPVFHISSSSSSTSVTSSSSPVQTVGNIQLTLEQERRAINFILGLEHCCWNHFAMGDFHLHDDGPETSDSEKGHALMASAYCMASAPDNIFSDRAAFQDRSGFKTPPSFQWGASGITLQSLYGLASSLNPGDVEITPVQAWFELASRYPMELLMGGQVLDTLQREFNGVTRCVMYGAVIERLAFENILARVLGPSEGSLLL